MKTEKVDFVKTGKFTPLFTDYVNTESSLKPFYGFFPSLENFNKQLQEKQLTTEKRGVLKDVLTKQYEGLKIPDAVRNNISYLADENTFTITTGHQLNIFTGPLYFIYKIITVINTCDVLSKEYPDYNFVPVYWMASEDHDFDEINFFRLNGKKYSWPSDQKGAVGRFNPNELKKLAAQIPGIPSFFNEAYSKKTLSEAVLNYTNELFGKYGLVTLDADCADLKREMSDVIEDDIFSNIANDLVNETSQKLDSAGYKTQVFPREINFFYLKENLRERIVKEGDEFAILNTDIKLTEAQLKEEIKSNPERFSPNVILRPLYQELILPNLAYCGGPGELAYWLQLKEVFEYYKTPFPILLPRNFAMVIPHHVKRKMNKAELSTEDLFKDKHQLLKEVAINNSEHNLLLNGQKDELIALFEAIKTQAASIDPTLAPHVEAQQTILKHKLENIEKKFIRAEKKNQSDRIRQIEGVFDTLLPNNSLQERTDNFLNFFMSDPSFIDQLINYFEPLDFRFNVLVDGE